jgi:hypothetical protein
MNFTEALTNYVNALQESINERFSKNYSNLKPRIVEMQPGRNYVRIVSRDGNGSGGHVHSFVVMKETKGFKVGDILKAATFKAPALNFARGNIFNNIESASTQIHGL